jgi:hypothetical protein
VLIYIPCFTKQGGPEYEVKLEGEASSIQYRFDRTTVEYGNILYDKFATEDITITNSGKVKLDFAVRTDAVARPSCVKAVPSTGVLMPGEKTKITVHFLPGMPSFIQTQFTVEVAHFDPQVLFLACVSMHACVTTHTHTHIRIYTHAGSHTSLISSYVCFVQQTPPKKNPVSSHMLEQIINITGKGVFPHITIGLPRLDPKNFARLLMEAQQALGFVGFGGLDTARTEGLPSATTRTAVTDADRYVCMYVCVHVCSVCGCFFWRVF